MRTVREIITIALEELDEHGWCQNTGMDEEGKICLGNALYRGIPLDAELKLPIYFPYVMEIDVWTDVINHVHEAILTCFPERITSTPIDIPVFNDDTRTTEEDIRLVLKYALENL